jgi:hypothetical protein
MTRNGTPTPTALQRTASPSLQVDSPNMKRILHSTSLVVSGGLVILITCLWAWSYHAPLSLLFSHACGEVECLTDRGIVQVDLVWGCT